LKKIV